MDGLCLYCLREKTEGPAAISAKGIDEKGETFVIPYRQLEAVVSTVSLDEFGSEQIQRKAHEDLSWITQKSITHEKVIEEAMIKNGKILSVVPMRLGIIFKDKAGLENVLARDYSKFKEILEKIRGKREWSVKVYLADRIKFEQTTGEKNDAIREKKKELASLPEGMAFFMEEELKEIISEQVDKELSHVLNDLFETLAKHSADSAKNRVLTKELTGKSESMVLNSAYLVCEEKVQEFNKEIESLKQQMCAKGVFLESSGPWPAFNFTSL
jgi:hypothetical protein